MKYNELLSLSSFIPERIVSPGGWVGHLPFAYWLVGITKPQIFVELGTHSGNSYLTFCQAVKATKSNTRCYAVDTWKGDEHSFLYSEDIFDEINTYHNPLYSSFSTLIRATFDDALGQFADESINLLHIDGLHTYDAVKHDFETWLPKLVPGAIVLFHDISVYERDFGVWKFWSELCERYPYHLSFQHSHGLGVLQISDDPAKTMNWLIPKSEEQNIIFNYFTGLGLSMKKRYELIEQSQKFQIERDQHKQLELHLKEEIRQLKYQVSRYRKLLSPLLFCKRIITGNFKALG